MSEVFPYSEKFWLLLKFYVSYLPLWYLFPDKVRAWKLSSAWRSWTSYVELPSLKKCHEMEVSHQISRVSDTCQSWKSSVSLGCSIPSSVTPEANKECFLMDPGYCIRSSKGVQVWSKPLALGGVSVWLPNHKAGLTGLETPNTAPVPLQPIFLFCVSTSRLASSSTHELRKYLTWTQISFCNDCRPVKTAQSWRVLLCHLHEIVCPWWLVERLHTCSVEIGHQGLQLP